MGTNCAVSLANIYMAKIIDRVFLTATNPKLRQFFASTAIRDTSMIYSLYSKNPMLKNWELVKTTASKHGTQY
jgi:hypothetical protein